jgi:hypothetical protein
VPLLTPIGSTAPSGALATIGLTTGPVSLGDLVLAFYGWAASGAGAPFSGVSDPLAQAWTAFGFPNNTGETGGACYCIANQGWASNVVTGTVAPSAPGGRIGLAFKVAAAQLAGTPFDQHVQGALQTSQTPSTVTAALAQAIELVIGFDLQRAAAGTAAFTWANGFTADGGITGVGTPASGIFVGELVTSSSAAVTAGGSSAAAGDRHELDVLAFKLSSAPPVVDVTPKPVLQPALDHGESLSPWLRGV